MRRSGRPLPVQELAPEAAALGPRPQGPSRRPYTGLLPESAVLDEEALGLSEGGNSGPGAQAMPAPLSPELAAWLATAREPAVPSQAQTARPAEAGATEGFQPSVGPADGEEASEAPEEDVSATVDERPALPVAAVPPVETPVVPTVSSNPLVPEGPEENEALNRGSEAAMETAAQTAVAGAGGEVEAVPAAAPGEVAAVGPIVSEAAPEGEGGAREATELRREEEPEGAPVPESSGDVQTILRAPDATAEEAAPAPETGGALTELEEWRARVRSSTEAVQHPSLAGASERVLRPVQGEGGAAAERHREAGRGMPARGRGAVTDAPPVAQELPPLEPDPVPEATAGLEAASDRRLPDQTPPALLRSPQGNLPLLGQRPLSEEEFRALISPPLVYGPPTEEEALELERLEQLRQAMLDPAPEVEGEAEGEQAPLVDEGIEPPPPLPAFTRTDLKGVLARLLENSQAEALSLLRNARTAAYSGTLETNFSGLGDAELLPEMETSLTTQLQGIREQAGISADEMTEAITARRGELERQRTGAAADVQNEAESTSGAVRQAGQERLDAVESTQDAVEAEVEQRQQAVENQGDPAAVYARRDRLVTRVNERIGGQVAAYRQAGEKRQAELSRAESAQAAAYRRAAQQDELQILNRAPDPADPLTQDAAAASRAWAQEQITAVQAAIQQLRTETRRSVDQYQGDVRAAGAFAREALYAWAEATTGERRSFWQSLFDTIKGWGEQARAESQAWAAVENRRTAEAIAGDLAFVNQLSRAAADGLTEESLRQSGSLNAAEDAMVTAFFQGGEAGNTIAAVAAGLRVRLAAEHLPALLQRFEKLLIDRPREDWEALRNVARAVNPAFNPEKLTTDLHRAVDQWGTDEPAIYRALANLSPLEVAILRKVYSVRGWGDLDAELRDELSGNELQRAQRLMASEPRAADAAALREAIEGAGTDEATIMSVLRNKSPEERRQIVEAYNAMYGASLEADLQDDLGGSELQRAELLMDGNTAAADALAVHDSLHGFWGADVDEVSNVYSQIREDVAAQAACEGWTTAQMEAEIRRRNGQVESEFNGRFAGDYGTPSGQSALRHQFQITLFNPAERDLANALADNDLARADAARIRIEETGVYASDEKINGVLNSQYTRALENVRRDVGPELRRHMVTDRLRTEAEAAQAAGTPWSAADQWARQQALERAYERELESRARVQAEDNMGALEGVYQGEYNRNLGSVIENNMSGNDLLEARDRLDQGGYLTPAQQVYYAVDGPGTKEEELKAALRGRTEAEIQTMREEYELAHPGRSFDADILGDVSGRDYFDMQVALEGEPETVQAMLDRERLKVQYEQDTGLLGSLGAAGAEKAWMAGRLQALEQDAARMHDTSLPAAERARLIDQFNYQVEVVDDAIEEHRRALDSFAETAAMVAGIVAGVIVTALTLGTAGPVVAGMLAALAATAASMTTRALVLGRAYGLEAVGVDLAVGAVDIIFAGLTAGMAGRLLGVVGRQGMQSLKQAGPIMSRLLKIGPIARLAGKEAGAIARAVRPIPALQRATQGGQKTIAAFMAREAAEVGEAVSGSLPSAALGNTLNDANWENGNPVANILMGTVQQVGQGVAMGRGMAYGGAIASKGVQLWRGRGPATPGAPGRGDILADRGTPAQRLERWRQFKAENPGASFAEFSQQLDEGLLARRAEGETARQQQKETRRQLLEGVPPKERGVLAALPIRRVSEGELANRGARPGDASILTSEGGAAVLLVRDGATAAELSTQGQGLARALVRDPSGRPVDANRVLPLDLQGRVPVAVDPTLASNTVRVVYDIDVRTGLVSKIRLLVGPGATTVDISLHAGTVRLMERYAGFLGRVRQILDRIQAWVKNNGPPQPGTRAWEARLEAEKLPRIIQDRMDQLRSGALSPQARKAVIDDIANLQRQLETHELALREMEMEPGRGFVAAEGKPEVTQPKGAGEAVPSGKVSPETESGTPATPAAALAAEPKSVRDVQLDPFWSNAKKEIAGFEPLMRQLESRPDILAPRDFQTMLGSIRADAGTARAFVNQLNMVLKRMGEQTSSGRDLSGMESVIKGLGSEDPAVRASARSLMEMAAKVTNPVDSGLLAANAILRKFDLTDVQAIRDLHPSVKDLDLMKALADVARDVDADGATIRGLITEAGSIDPRGTVTPDLRRLNAILESMGPGPHSASDVSAGIKRQNELAAELANVSSDLVEAVLKETGLIPVAGQRLDLGKVPAFQANGKVSGSKVNDFFRKDIRVDRILRDIVDSTGGINEAQWLKLQDTLRNTDIDPVIMNGIIGYYWERIRLRALETQLGSGRVFDQVNITMKGQTEKPRIDAVIIKSVDKDANVVRIELEEDKTGRAVLSDAQQALYDRAIKRLGKADPDIKVELPPDVLNQLSDPSKVTVIIERFEVERAPSKLKK